MNPQIPRARRWDLAAGRELEEHTSVLFWGPTGVGKTHLAQSLGVLACRQGKRVRVTSTNALLADLAGGRADGSWATRLRREVPPDRLLLDDFALRADTPAQAEDLEELVSRRERHSAFSLTTNRDPNDREPLFPTPVLAEGLLDRRLNSAEVIPLQGRSDRPAQRPLPGPSPQPSAETQPTP